MQKIALAPNTINEKPGRWAEVGNFHVFVDSGNKIIAPSDLRGQTLENLDVTSLQGREVSPEKIQLVMALMAANTISYDRLTEYIDNLANAIKMGTEPDVEKNQYDRLKTFIASYTPVDTKMHDFLKKYEITTRNIMEQLGAFIDQNVQPAKPAASMVPTVKKENPINVRKFGLYRFPFLLQEKLYLGDIESHPTIPQDWNYAGTHWKLWKNINKLPFLVNGYQDGEYSAVNRVLAAQAAKIFGLQCEEVFFGYLHGQCVTLTAFHEAVTLLENQAFEMYQLASNYMYQSDQKKAFYYLIQHWQAYTEIRGETKERFNLHYVDADGNVFLSEHQNAMWLTPQLMARNLMVKLEINALTYRPIKDMVLRVGDKDVADIVFSSIPEDFIELHDELATKLNKTTFEKKRACFDENWTRLLESIEDFEKIKISGVQ